MENQSKIIPLFFKYYIVKYLIAGLGNVGEEYANTRHNIGFDVADLLINDLKGDVKVEKLASVSKVKFKGRTLVIIKPTTFMNLSGKSIKYWLDKEKVPTNILISATRWPSFSAFGFAAGGTITLENEAYSTKVVVGPIGRIRQTEIERK